MKPVALGLLLALSACPHRDEVHGVHVWLSVKTNPPTDVTVVRPGAAPVALGRSPIEHVAGAQVGDTIRLTNADAGVSYEEVIEYGEPGGAWRITKVFMRGADAGR